MEVDEEVGVRRVSVPTDPGKLERQLGKVRIIFCQFGPKLLLVAQRNGTVFTSFGELGARDRNCTTFFDVYIPSRMKYEFDDVSIWCSGKTYGDRSTTAHLK